MKISIIGAGNVGGTLGKAWAKRGHTIFYGLRNPSSTEAAQLIGASGSTAIATDVPGAAQAGEVILLATPWAETQDALGAAGDLSGKVLLDATNPLLPELAGLAVGTDTSGGEMVAAWAPGARVVKAFNTVGYNIMAESEFPQGKAALFYCGDDPHAKATVGQLVAELGFDALDAGPLQQSRLLEPFAMLWISLAVKYGYTREIAFQFMRREPGSRGS